VAQAKLKICKFIVKRNGEEFKCDVPYTGELCPNREHHLMKYRTGFCQQGFCEGTKPRSYSGKAIATCKFFATCPCKCHKDLDLLFKMSGKDRLEAVPNPEWTPAPREFWLPSDDPAYMPRYSSTHDAVSPPVIIESPAPDLVPATVAHSYAPTATGRAARGELESWVKTKCDEWLVEKYQTMCTPSWISEEIGHDQAIKPPSVGAISAVFDRWVKLGFAVVAKKPTRFLHYTDEGKRLGLDGMKARARRQRDLAQAELKRGTLR
jgi:hypothetical protein